MNKFDAPLFVTVAVFSEEQLTAVYGLLGGVSATAVAAAAPAVEAPKAVAVKPAIEPSSAGSETPAPESPASDGSGPSAPIAASPSSVGSEVDTGGHPWSPDLHASTQTKTKDGYWRMKVGVTRPADLPGFPKAEAGAPAIAAASPSPTPAPSPSAADAGPEAAPAVEPSSAAAPAVEEDDEFAAFREADAASTAPVDVPARTWSDADLSKLCNQAATKLANPAPVKALIEQFVTVGEVPHSRNIPDDKREDFAKAVEAAADITFAG